MAPALAADPPTHLLLRPFYEFLPRPPQLLRVAAATPSAPTSPLLPACNLAHRYFSLGTTLSYPLTSLLGVGAAAVAVPSGREEVGGSRLRRSLRAGALRGGRSAQAARPASAGRTIGGHPCCLARLGRTWGARRGRGRYSDLPVLPFFFIRFPLCRTVVPYALCLEPSSQRGPPV